MVFSLALLRRADGRDRKLSRPLVHLGFKRHFLPFLKTIYARSFKGRCVDEHVIPALVGLDKPVALRSIIEFYRASFHDLRPCRLSSSCRRNIAQKAIGETNPTPTVLPLACKGRALAGTRLIPDIRRLIVSTVARSFSLRCWPYPKMMT